MFARMRHCVEGIESGMNIEIIITTLKAEQKKWSPSCGVVDGDTERERDIVCVTTMVSLTINDNGLGKSMQSNRMTIN